MTSNLLLSAADARMAPLLDLSERTFRRFAALHGYDVEVRRWNSVLGRRLARWQKVELLRQALDSHEFVVWLDADAVICRFDRDVADDLCETCFQGLVLEQVWDRFNPNTGLWVMRRDARAFELLDELLAAGLPEHSWSDQAALCLALGWSLGDFHGHGAKPVHGSRFLEGTQWLSPEWNPTGIAANVPTARVRHFAGQSLAVRHMRMERMVKAIEHADRLHDHGEFPGTTWRTSRDVNVTSGAEPPASSGVTTKSV